MTKETDKRKNRRKTVVVPIDSKKGSIFDEMNVVDISKGGLGFISTRRIPVNRKINIELNLQEDDEPVFVVGRVLYSRAIKGSSNYRIGVTFDDIMRGSKTRLKTYFHS